MTLNGAQLVDVERLGTCGQLTWTLDNVFDVRRMLCHVRCILSASNVPNVVRMDASARKVVAIVTVPPTVNLTVMGEKLAVTFA